MLEPIDITSQLLKFNIHYNYMKRLVAVTRWTDSWFVELHPNAKLLLSYLYDTCDDSGTIDVNYNIWASQLNMDKPLIITSLKALQVKLLSDKKKKLFIKDFLRHQEKLPLVRGRKEDDWIINKLKSNLEVFDNDSSITKILEKTIDLKDIDKPEKGKKKGEKFVAPDFEAFSKYCLEEKPDAEEMKIKSLFNHYVSCGWKVGNKPMKDWKAAIRVNIHKEEKAYKNYNNNTGTKTSRTETTLSVVDELKKNN